MKFKVLLLLTIISGNLSIFASDYESQGEGDSENENIIEGYETESDVLQEMLPPLDFPTNINPISRDVPFIFIKPALTKEESEKFFEIAASGFKNKKDGQKFKKLAQKAEPFELSDGLMIAVENNRPEVVKYLLKEGALPGLENELGYDALTKAILLKNIEVIEIIFNTLRKEGHAQILIPLLTKKDKHFNRSPYQFAVYLGREVSPELVYDAESGKKIIVNIYQEIAKFLLEEAKSLLTKQEIEEMTTGKTKS